MRNVGRTSTSTTSRSVDELLRAGDEHALLVEHERRAVEHELVLAADEVRVDDRHRRVGGARREHRLAFDEALRVVRRRVEVDDELGAARGLGEDRPDGLHASSQIETPTCTPAMSNSGSGSRGATK